MPWKVSSVMEERLRYVARLLEGEPMTDLCSAFASPCEAGYLTPAGHRNAAVSRRRTQ